MRWTNKSISAVAAAWMALCTIAGAQVALDARLLHSRTMKYEPIGVKVRVENNLSDKLQLGSDDPKARLVFVVERGPGNPVSPLPSAKRIHFKVPPHNTGTVEVDLQEIYDMRDTGPYTVRARVDWKGTSYSSPRMYLDVVPGLSIGEMTVEAGGGFRKLTLRTLHRERKEYLFLVIENARAGICYGAFDLGRIVRVQKPMLTIDAEEQIHILHQSAPTHYTHTILTSEGEQIGRVLYGGDAGQVRLEGSPDGGVTVRGGREASQASPEAFRMPSGMRMHTDSEPVPMR
jgi:hypothetical protein